jgi:DNA-binding GntR family transcriptional regulator
MNQIESIEKINIERNLQNRVYEIIKNYLIRPDVPPGTHLYEDRLAKEIGVSRTPVKIALNKLEQQGLIKINYNKGAFKVHLSLKEVIEIIKIRETLECLSLEMINDFDLKLIEDLYKSIPDINSI